MVPCARKAVWRWGRSCGLGTVASSTPIRFGFPRAAPRAASFLPVHEEGEAAVAAREESTKRDAAAGEGGGDGAEVAEERTEVVTYAAAIDVAKGSGMVCTRVRDPARPQAADGVAGGCRLRVGDRADGSPAVRGYPAAGAREHLRLLADLLLPGRGRGPGGVAGQRPRREAPARPGQIRPGRQRVAVQAERAGDAAPLVRAAAGGPGPAGADPEPGPGWPRTRPGTRTGSRRSSRTRW